MKFRIKHIPDFGFYAQVKMNLFSSWKTIGKHNGGFGLYPNGHTDYPINTKIAALGRCSSFEYYKKSEGKATYEDVLL
jgi:hypothetical protein